MIPSIVGQQLEERFENLLKTQFRVRPDSGFRNLWDDFFTDPERLIKGPYLQFPLPFRKSTDAAALTRFAPAIAKLPFPPYEHQVKSFDRVCDFKSTLVATGTGSGKTECFTLPILAHCAKYANELGIRAILIYPMNALAADQAKRLAETICANAGLKGVRVGLYIGESKGKSARKGQAKRWREVGYDAETQSYHVITDRETMLREPPHILLTNYKMLDYLLLRPKEKRLWDHNRDPGVLKFLAVDELHTFDGAQAADLACLLRRLKERLRMPDESLCCIGTSATLGTSADASARIRSYARKVFSSDFPTESLITEDRLTFDEMQAQVKDPIFGSSFARAVFEGLANHTRTIVDLAKALKKRADDELWDDPPQTVEECVDRILEFCTGLSKLRAEKGRDYPDVKIQYWLRELARVVASVPTGAALGTGPEGQHADGPGRRPQLAFTDDLDDPDKLMSKNVRYFPIDNCNVCGATAWIGLVSHDGERLEGTRKQIIDAYFGHRRADDLRLVYPLGDKPQIAADCRGSQGKGICGNLRQSVVRLFCGKCRRLLPEGTERCACGHDRLIRVAVDRPGPCPYCGGDHGNNLMVGMRSATMLSTCISTLTTSKDNADKKILTFSDNVQDTSQRAGFFGGRTWAATFRAHLAQYFTSRGGGEIPYRDFIEGFPAYLSKRLPDVRDQFAELIPQNLKWLNDWRRLKGDDPPAPTERTMQAFFARLRWETALEFGCGQHLGRTLTRTKIAALKAKVPDGLPEDVRAFYERMAARMIRGGAFEDLALLNSAGTSWFSILTTVMNRGNMKVVNGLESAGVRVYKTKRSTGLAIPGVAPGKHKSPILDEIADTREAELLSALAKDGHFREFVHPDGTKYGYLPIDALAVVASDEGASDDAQDNPFRRQYLEGEIHRVIPAEHTGLLSRDEREALESRFKAKAPRRWDPNLISATPTLEMGVDIGDLSSVLLCSVPPNQSKFIQRIGRSGRRNGSSLNVTVAAAKPHDLYFYRDPAEMISGNVATPGVFLDASAILERQYLGFALSEWLLSSGDPQFPDTIGRMFKAIDDGDSNAFPKSFVAWYDESKDGLVQRFQTRLGNFNPVHPATTAALLDFAYSDVFGKNGICGRLEDAVVTTRTSLKNYEQKQRDLAKLRKAVEKDPGLTDELRADRLLSLDVEIKCSRTFISNLRKQSVMGWLCDCAGLLPNYAFPEPGVHLQTILWRHEVKTEPPKYEKIEISRPASSGLTELVPGSTFYTHGHHMLIDQVDLQRYSEEEVAACQWRLCPACDHIEQVKSDTPAKCPNCGSDWSDNGQVRNLLPVRQFVTVRPDDESLNDDRTDNRELERYECRKFFEKDRLSDGVQCFQCKGDGLPFAFEYVPHLVLREVNFGFRSFPKAGEAPVVVNGEPLTGLGFRVCRECNKAVPESRGAMPAAIRHVKTCKALLAPRDGNDETPQDVKVPLNVSFYREYHTEALRIFAPFLGEDDDVRVMSFMAAIQLGLKEHFKGEVDHLQMEVQSLPLPGKSLRQHFLILYDAVPGGTGYVRQFAEGEKPKLLFDIFEEALAKLKSCTCASDPLKDGCYNCLYRYRNQNGRGAVSRQAAIRILEELVPRRKCLKKLKDSEGIAASTAGLIESELEKRFVLRLASMAERLGGKLEDATVRGYVKGWRVRLPGAFKLGAKQIDREWEIVPQKSVGPEDGVLVRSRPDFLFYPIGAEATKEARPVAVFLDGWEYHKDIVAEDVVKRAALMDANCRVWSLAWDDVAPIAPGKTESPPDPAWRLSLTEGPARTELGMKFYGDKGERAQAWHDHFNHAPQEIDRFVAYLQTADDALFSRHVSFETALLMVVGVERREPPVKKTLPSAFTASFDGGVAVRIKEPLFEAGIALRKDANCWGGIRPCLAAALDDQMVLAKEAWQGFFAFLTYFQFLNRDCIAFTLKSRDDAFWANLSTVRSETARGGDSAEWDEAIVLADGDAFCTAALNAIRKAGLPPPKMFEDVLAADGAVLASPWMQWEAPKLLAVPLGEIADVNLQGGWKAIPIDVAASPEKFVETLKEAYNG